jgi:hypothetical protein
VQLLDAGFLAKQFALHLDLGEEIVKVPFGLRRVFGDDLVAAAIETNGVAEGDVDVDRKWPADGPDVPLACPDSISVRIEGLDKAIGCWIRRVPGTFTVQTANQVEIDFQRRMSVSTYWDISQ